MQIVQLPFGALHRARSTPDKGVQLAYSVWIVALALVYFGALQSGNTVFVPYIWGALGVSGAGALLYGAAKCSPTYMAPWLCFFTAMMLFVTGDCYFKVQHFIVHRTDPFPSFADVLYLLTYPLFGAGLYLLIRRRAYARSSGAVLDALTLTVSLALFLWVYLLLPTIRTDGSMLARAVSVAYPLGDVVVWAFLIRLLIVDLRTRSIQLLGLGAFGLIMSDIVYSFGQFYGTWHEGNIFDVGWMVFYGAWGLAALHPSVQQLAQPISGTAPAIRARRLVLLALAALAAPLLLFVKSIEGRASEVAGAIAVFATVLFVLVILRLYTLTRALTERETDLRLTQEKDELLAITSHQLRTPLTVIQLYAEALGGTHDPAQTKKYISVIAQANKRMIDIVNQLVYTAELDMGSITLKSEPVALSQVVQQAVKDADALLKEKQVTVHTIVPADTPVALGDARALTAIVSGLLNNAARYGKEITPSIDITTLQTDRHVVLTITDNGHGIPAADQARIFTKLFRASNARALAPDGSGLSLYLARAVLGRMNGAISLASTEGEGTTVSVTLPLARGTP